jgi:hypothetical protein
MPKKVLATDLNGNIQQQKIVFKKAAPKKWVEPEWLKQYRIERDRLIWKLHPESREEIEEFYKTK